MVRQVGLEEPRWSVLDTPSSTTTSIRPSCTDARNEACDGTVSRGSDQRHHRIRRSRRLGLMAGINAALAVMQAPALVLGREEAHLGVWSMTSSPEGRASRTACSRRARSTDFCSASTGPPTPRAARRAHRPTRRVACCGLDRTMDRHRTRGAGHRERGASARACGARTWKRWHRGGAGAPPRHGRRGCPAAQPRSRRSLAARSPHRRGDRKVRRVRRASASRCRARAPVRRDQDPGLHGIPQAFGALPRAQREARGCAAGDPGPRRPHRRDDPAALALLAVHIEKAQERSTG